MTNSTKAGHLIIVSKTHAIGDLTHWCGIGTIRIGELVPDNNLDFIEEKPSAGTEIKVKLLRSLTSSSLRC